MGTATLIRKFLHFLLYGFYRPLHKARFASFDEKWKILTANPPPLSLLLGVNRFKQFYHVRSLPTRRELGNMLIVAPTRGGKGLLATTQLFTWGGSAIVNDLKGDLFTQTAGYRATLGNVYVINPTSGIGHRYDPLTNYQTEHELFMACHKLLYESRAVDPYWQEAAMNMFKQIFLAARMEHQPLFPYAQQITRLGLPAAGKYLQTVSPELATQFLGMPLASVNFETARMLQGSWSSLTTKLQYFLSETVVNSVACSDFISSELMTGLMPATIYLQWPERHLKPISPLIRLIVGSLIDKLITTYDTREGKGCRPVLMLMDEATRTEIPSLADHATTVVGRGISLWVAIQSLKHLEAVYGADNAQVLRDNMESQIYYRPTDVATAEYLERRLGQKSGYARSETSRTDAEIAKGKSEQAVELMTAQEIMQMRDEQIVLFHRHFPAMKAYRVSWIGNSIFEKRRKIPPPPLANIPECKVTLPAQAQVQNGGYVDPYTMLRRVD